MKFDKEKAKQYVLSSLIQSIKENRKLLIIVDKETVTDMVNVCHDLKNYFDKYKTIPILMLFDSPKQISELDNLASELSIKNAQLQAFNFVLLGTISLLASDLAIAYCKSPTKLADSFLSRASELYSDMSAEDYANFVKSVMGDVC